MSSPQKLTLPQITKEINSIVIPAFVAGLNTADSNITASIDANGNLILVAGPTGMVFEAVFDWGGTDAQIRAVDNAKLVDGATAVATDTKKKGVYNKSATSWTFTDFDVTLANGMYSIVQHYLPDDKKGNLIWKDNASGTGWVFEETGGGGAGAGFIPVTQSAFNALIAGGNLQIGAGYFVTDAGEFWFATAANKVEDYLPADAKDSSAAAGETHIINNGARVSITGQSTAQGTQTSWTQTPYGIIQIVAKNTANQNTLVLNPNQFSVTLGDPGGSTASDKYFNLNQSGFGLSWGNTRIVGDGSEILFFAGRSSTKEKMKIGDTEISVFAEHQDDPDFLYGGGISLYSPDRLSFFKIQYIDNRLRIYSVDKGNYNDVYTFPISNAHIAGDVEFGLYNINLTTNEADAKVLRALQGSEGFFQYDNNGNQVAVAKTGNNPYHLTGLNPTSSVWVGRSI